MSATDTPLSPAAAAVLDAYGNEVGGTAAITSYERRGASAALRAAADAVAPLEIMGGPDFANEPAATAARQRTRRKLLTIANELETGR